MQTAPSLTLYTYTTTDDIGDDRWKDRALADHFFKDLETARRDLLEVRDQITTDGEPPFDAICLERIETVPMTEAAILALLNDGVGAIISRYEIIERIDVA
ncbi:hypothetical protein OE766_25370 [Pararhizobium sp. YC-54]|uniref:hypothetical protein n=1 Tax=Pararhizobium sp. YC-54 TaxID=2986920 RepID=UPI0021F7BC3B|nr:hypothetical protein [Pararhizobium sp. YC-54]MCW0001554.1 hypothetical protein [Pararhizobium sp. YC-54]